jgi:hypothetical protein
MFGTSVLSLCENRIVFNNPDFIEAVMAAMISKMAHGMPNRNVMGFPEIANE